MTNFIRTEQFQNKCEEEPEKHKAKCRTDDDCKKLGTLVNGWNG